MTWSATGGSLTISGGVATYTAGPVDGTFRIVAASVADPFITDTAVIVISSSRIEPEGNVQMNVNAQASTSGWGEYSRSDENTTTVSETAFDGFDVTRAASASLSWPDDPERLGDWSGSGFASSSARAKAVIKRDPMSGNVIEISGEVDLASNASHSGFGSSSGSASTWQGFIRFLVWGEVGFTLEGSCALSLTVSDPENGDKRLFAGLKQVLGGTDPGANTWGQCTGTEPNKTFNATGRIREGSYGMDMAGDVRVGAASPTFHPGEIPVASGTGRIRFKIVFSP